MIRTLRAFFLSRLLREKLLLVAFALLGVLMWLSSFAGRAGLFLRQQSATTATLEDQQRWLTHRVEIETATQKAAARFVAENTLNAQGLFAEVDRLAKDAGLTASLDDQHDEVSGQFGVVHTLQVSIPKADWTPLAKFYQALLARSPYISIEQFVMRVNPIPTTPHTVVLRVSSLEIPK